MNKLARYQNLNLVRQTEGESLTAAPNSSQNRYLLTVEDIEEIVQERLQEQPRQTTHIHQHEHYDNGFREWFAVMCAIAFAFPMGFAFCYTFAPRNQCPITYGN